MGVYKICEHKGRARDRCDHAWWGSFRGKRVSLEKWANRDIETKAAAGEALDDLRAAIRTGTFDERPRTAVETSPLTLSTFAEAYKQRHVLAKALALADASTTGSSRSSNASVTVYFQMQDGRYRRFRRGLEETACREQHRRADAEPSVD